MTKIRTINDLPRDVLGYISSYLPAKDKKNSFLGVSRLFHCALEATRIPGDIPVLYYEFFALKWLIDNTRGLAILQIIPQHNNEVQAATRDQFIRQCIAALIEKKDAVAAREFMSRLTRLWGSNAPQVVMKLSALFLAFLFVFFIQYCQLFYSILTSKEGLFGAAICCPMLILFLKKAVFPPEFKLLYQDFFNSIKNNRAAKQNIKIARSFFNRHYPDGIESGHSSKCGSLSATPRH